MYLSIKFSSSLSIKGRCLELFRWNKIFFLSWLQCISYLSRTFNSNLFSLLKFAYFNYSCELIILLQNSGQEEGVSSISSCFKVFYYNAVLKNVVISWEKISDGVFYFKKFAGLCVSLQSSDSIANAFLWILKAFSEKYKAPPRDCF